MALGRPFCGHCCASRRVWPRAGRGVRVCLCVCVCECVRVCVNEAHHRARRFGRLRVFASVVSSPSTAPSSASAEFRHFLPQRSRSQPPPPHYHHHHRRRRCGRAFDRGRPGSSSTSRSFLPIFKSKSNRSSRLRRVRFLHRSTGCGVASE